LAREPLIFFKISGSKPRVNIEVCDIIATDILIAIESFKKSHPEYRITKIEETGMTVSLSRPLQMEIGNGQ
jgi:hypothetical protein